MTVRHTTALGGVAALVLLAGCAGVSLPEAPPTTESPVADQCSIEELSFERSIGNDRWAPDRVQVRYELTGSADVLLVAFETETALGARHVTSDGPRTDRNVTIELDEPLTGIHSVRVLAYGDVDGNGEFDKLNDQFCEDDRGALQTIVISRNFSSYGTAAGS